VRRIPLNRGAFRGSGAGTERSGSCSKLRPNPKRTADCDWDSENSAAKDVSAPSSAIF
jgi:hypothetical protein